MTFRVASVSFALAIFICLVESKWWVHPKVLDVFSGQILC